MVPAVGLPVQSGQQATQSQDAFKMKPSHCTQFMYYLQEARIVAWGPAPSTLLLPLPIPVSGLSTTLVPIKEHTIPIVEDLPPATKANFKGVNVDLSTIHHCTIVHGWFGIHCADPGLCSQGLSPRSDGRSD